MALATRSGASEAERSGHSSAACGLRWKEMRLKLSQEATKHPTIIRTLCGERHLCRSAPRRSDLQARHLLLCEMNLHRSERRVAVSPELTDDITRFQHETLPSPLLLKDTDCKPYPTHDLTHHTTNNLEHDLHTKRNPAASEAIAPCCA